MSFTITHNTNAIEASERRIEISFTDAGGLDNATVVVRRADALDAGEHQAPIIGSRAAAILTAGGYAPADIRDALLLLIREAALDKYDDARQS